MANEIQFPTSPTNGNIYSMGGRNYRYDSAQDKFVAVATATIVEGGGVTIYATIDNLPLSGNTQGDLAHVTSNNTLYFWNGSGWYKIALINNSPSISNVNSSYTLSDIGADTVITMVAEDPEGLAITYSIASDTSGNTATVVQGAGANTNIFTITPSTDANDNGTFSLTFRASDGVNIATAPASFTLNISTTVENSNYTTALITSVGTNNQVNNDFVDSSSSSHTITVNGDATQTTFSPYRHGGYSTYFDGTSDYLDLPASSTHNIGTGDFTLETWFNTTSASNDTQFRRMFMLDGPTGNATGNIQLTISSNGYVNGWTNSGDVDLRSSTGLNDGAWHHAAIVRSGSTLTLYVDGASVDSMTYSTSITFNSGSPRPRIASYNGTGGDWLGYLVDLRLVVGTAVYTSAFTPPTERLTAITNTSLLTCHLPYIADGSTNGHTITANGNTKTEPFSPIDYIEEYTAASHGGSIYFDGSSRVEAPDSADWNQDTDFTIEAWFYPMSIPGNYVHMFGQWQSGGGGNRNTQLTLDPNGRVFMTVNRSGTNYSTPLGTTLKINNWYHVAVTLNGTTLTVWVNGKNDGSITVGGSTNNSTMGWAIGGEPGSGSYPFTGVIADTRVVKGTAVYTADFTPPTAPLTAITNTKLLLSGTNAGIIDKSQSVKTILNGDVKSSTTQTKYLSSSMYFDGTGDCISTSNSAELGTGDFTLEAWVYPTTLNSNDAFIAEHWSGTTAGFIFRAHTNNYLSLFDGTTNRASSTAIVTNQWQHVAASRESGTLKLFIDGTQVLSVATSSSLTGPGSGESVTIGAITTSSGFGSTFTGYISDARITKGLARYTANFTPPPTALEG